MTSLGDWTTRTDHPDDPRNAKELDFYYDVVNIEEKGYDHWDLPIVSIDGNEYAVAESESEAIAATELYIRESLWAFNTNFLIRYTSIDKTSTRVVDAIQQMQQDLCESANPIIYELVKDNFDELVEDAVGQDGTGHFLSPYDGEEREIKEIFDELVEGSYDDEVWDSDYVYECFVEYLANTLDFDCDDQSSWLFYRID